MVQTTQNLWRIESEKGVILQDDIRNIRSEYDANRYVQNYISSFVGWIATVVPLKKETKNDKV